MSLSILDSLGPPVGCVNLGTLYDYHSSAAHFSDLWPLPMSPTDASHVDFSCGNLNLSRYRCKKQLSHGLESFLKRNHRS